MASSWIFWAITAVVMFGLWGAFSKIAVDSVGWKNSTIFFALGVVWIVPVLYFVYPPQSLQPLSMNAIIFALLSGAVTVIAIIGFNIALTSGKASVVVPLTSLYPTVTIIIALLFLHEKLNLKQAAGIGLAIVAILLMSM